MLLDVLGEETKGWKINWFQDCKVTTRAGETVRSLCPQSKQPVLYHKSLSQGDLNWETRIFDDRKHLHVAIVFSIKYLPPQTFPPHCQNSLTISLCGDSLGLTSLWSQQAASVQRDVTKGQSYLLLVNFAAVKFFHYVWQLGREGIMLLLALLHMCAQQVLLSGKAEVSNIPLKIVPPF